MGPQHRAQGQRDVPGERVLGVPRGGEVDDATITITTDLYRAEVDTVWGVIAQVALLKETKSAKFDEA